MLSHPEAAVTNAVRVLLIERDAATAMDICAAMAACFAAPPDVVVATGGRAAADLLRRESRDLVLADLSSLSELAPEGEDAVARLAKYAAAAITIVLSEDSSVSATVAAMRAGAHDYLAKPVSAAAFGARIAALALRHGRSLGLNSALMLADPRMVESAPIVGDATGDATGGGRWTSQVLPMWQQEQRIIEQAIASFSGNIAQAAAALEVSPSTIYRKRQAWAESGAGKGAA